MDNLKKVGLTALAGSLAAVSAHAAEMTVSGATVLTYTSEDETEVTGNPLGMKTNIGFTASGDVNGYTVSYMNTSKDKFAGQSSARLSVDMGDMGVIAYDAGSGSGLATIDDKTPTAAEEIWDGLDGGGASSTSVGGLVGTAGNTGVINYVKSMGGASLNVAYRGASGTANSDGASSGAGQGAWDFAVTASGDTIGVDGLSFGFGYGEADAGSQENNSGVDDTQHMTAYANYAMGPVTFGYQRSEIQRGTLGAIGEDTAAWGLAFNVNDDLSISYGERTVTYDKTGAAATDVDEEGEGIAIAYTMGSMKIAGNRNEVSDNDNSTADTAKDENTEIAVSFAF